MRIVELIRGNEMTNRPQPQQFVGQSPVELDRRVKEEVSIREARHCHSGCEWKRHLYSGYGQIFEWPVDNADVGRERLVDVDWLVKRGTHIADDYILVLRNVGTNGPLRWAIFGPKR